VRRGHKSLRHRLNRDSNQKNPRHHLWQAAANSTALSKTTTCKKKSEGMHGDLFLGSDHSTAFLSECSSRWCSGFFFLFLSFQLALGRDLPPQLLANAIVPPVPFWVPHPIEGKKDLGGFATRTWRRGCRSDISVENARPES